jgi:hypothetical protein
LKSLQEEERGKGENAGGNEPNWVEYMHIWELNSHIIIIYK